MAAWRTVVATAYGWRQHRRLHGGIMAAAWHASIESGMKQHQTGGIVTRVRHGENQHGGRKNKIMT